MGSTWGSSLHLHRPCSVQRLPPSGLVHGGPPSPALGVPVVQWRQSACWALPLLSALPILPDGATHSGLTLRLLRVGLSSRNPGLLQLNQVGLPHILDMLPENTPGTQVRGCGVHRWFQTRVKVQWTIIPPQREWHGKGRKAGIDFGGVLEDDREALATAAVWALDLGWGSCP